MAFIRYQSIVYFPSVIHNLRRMLGQFSTLLGLRKAMGLLASRVLHLSDLLTTGFTLA